MLGVKKYYGMRGDTLSYAISFIAGLDFLLFGYDQGVTGGLLDLPSFVKYFPSINTVEELNTSDLPRNTRSTYQGIAVASYNLGCFCGAVFTIFVGNALGRKKTIFIGSIIMTIGALLQCTSYDLPQWIVGRLVTGWGNGMNTSTVPMWQSETAKSHQRGKLVMIEGMLITAGITISYWINYGFAWIGDNEVAWRFPLAFQIVFCLIIFGTIMNLPESPRWLVMKGREDEALEVLEYVNDMSRDDPNIITEFDDVKQTVVEMSKGSYRSLFEMSDYREFHRVVLAYVNQMYQQISGINLITYYAPTLYAGIGLGQNNYPKLLAACNGTEYLMAAFIPIFIVEKVGRRPLMLFGAAGMSLSMAALAISNYFVTLDPDNVNTQAGVAQAVFLFISNYFVTLDPDNVNTQAGVAQAVFLFVFNSFFAIGWLGMTWLYPAEIVPLKIRAPTNALSTSGNWIFNFMVVMITPVAFDTIGYQTYIIFAVINAFIFPTVYLFFPETRYRSLEEMDMIFKKSTNVFNVVPISIKEPFMYDRYGNRKQEFLEAGMTRRTNSAAAQGVAGGKSEKAEADRHSSGGNSEERKEVL